MICKYKDSRNIDISYVYRSDKTFISSTVGNILYICIISELEFAYYSIFTLNFRTFTNLLLQPNLFFDGG